MTRKFCLKATKDREPSTRSQNLMPNGNLRTRQKSAGSKRREQGSWYQSGLILEAAEEALVECSHTPGSLFMGVFGLRSHSRTVTSHSRISAGCVHDTVCLFIYVPLCNDLP